MIAAPTYTPAVGEWLTPHGQRAVLHYRAETNDWNVISSIMAPHDEYSLPRGLTGWAADIGAHIGAVSIALALDNPDLSVIAVEPVPQNVDLFQANVEANGLLGQVAVIAGAAGLRDPVTVWYGRHGEPSAEHHAFIGNNSTAYDHGGELPHETVEYPHPITLAWLVAMAGGRIAWCKIDAEGAEWDVLQDPAIRDIEYLIGEFHPVRGKRRGDLAPLLDPTHVLTYPDPPKGVDPEFGPGPFVAVRREAD